MRKFAFSYYVGLLVLVFFLYASFLRVVAPLFDQFIVGILAGALALVLVLLAIGAAWKANGHR